MLSICTSLNAIPTLQTLKKEALETLLEKEKTMFSETEIIIEATLNLSSVNTFNSVKAKLCHLVKSV